MVVLFVTAGLAVIGTYAYARHNAKQSERFARWVERG